MFVGTDISKLGKREEHIYEEKMIHFRGIVLSDALLIRIKYIVYFFIQ